MDDGAHTRARHRRTIPALLVVFLLLLAACTAGDGDTDTASTSRPPTTVAPGGATLPPSDPEPPGDEPSPPSDPPPDRGLQPDERPDLSMLTFVDNLMAKVEDGDWTLEEGLVATLAMFAGESDPTEVLRHGQVSEDELTGVLEMAAAYLMSGPDESVKPAIERLLARLTWSPDRLEAMAGIAGGDEVESMHESELPSAVVNAVLASFQDGTSEDCLQYFDGYDIEGVSQCLEVESRLIDGELYRVFSPAPPLPTAGWTPAHATTILDAAADTVAAYADRGLGALPPTNFVLSVIQSDVEIVSTLDPPVGIAGAVPVAGEPCGVVFFTGMQAYPTNDFKQIVAHELAHCYQRERFRPQAKPSYQHKKWWVEGQAEYLANVVYPDNNLEQRRLEFTGLAAHELTTTLFDRAYSNFLFFQYLSNRLGIDGMFGVVSSLPTGEGSGRSDQEKALAAVDGMETLFHEFVQAVSDEKVIDSDGSPIDYRMTEQNRPTMDLGGKAEPLLAPELPPFGVVRRLLTVPSGRQACLEEREVEDVTAKSRPEPEETWNDVPPVLPAVDEDPREMMLVVTSTEDGKYRLDVTSVHSMEEAAGDSVVGVWVLDHSSVHDGIEYLAPVQTVTSISGEVRATFWDDGIVEVVFDGFEVHGRADVELTEGVFSSNYAVQYSSVTNADGRTTYEIKGDRISYGEVFAENYLDGEEEVERARRGMFLRIETEERELEVDATPSEYTLPAGGWGMLAASEEFELLCGGDALRLDDAVFDYVGPPPPRD